MGVGFTGDWQRCMKVLDDLADKTKGEVGKKIGQSIKKIEAKVLDHVDNQDLGWEEPDAGYAAQKDRKGLSPDILQAGNQMYINITTRQDDDFTGAVGVRCGMKNDEGGDVTDIAVIQEPPDNDGNNIPARDLWQPTFDEIKEEIPPEIMGGVTGLIE
ncbi:MAG: hypothetical protein MI799_24540 [Desulfobacterales bacterium]|nr:hypothetical protein [Desulfobacterales bacterium]